MVEVQKKEESRAVLCDFSRFIFGKDIYTTKWYQYPSTLIWKIIRIYYNYMINTDEIHHMTEVQPTFETVVSLDFILFLYIRVKKVQHLQGLETPSFLVFGLSWTLLGEDRLHAQPLSLSLSRTFILPTPARRVCRTPCSRAVGADCCLIVLFRAAVLWRVTTGPQQRTQQRRNPT